MSRWQPRHWRRPAASLTWALQWMKWLQLSTLPALWQTVSTLWTFTARNVRNQWFIISPRWSPVFQCLRGQSLLHHWMIFALSPPSTPPSSPPASRLTLKTWRRLHSTLAWTTSLSTLLRKTLTLSSAQFLINSVKSAKMEAVLTLLDSKHMLSRHFVSRSILFHSSTIDIQSRDMMRWRSFKMMWAACFAPGSTPSLTRSLWDQTLRSRTTPRTSRPGPCSVSWSPYQMRLSSQLWEEKKTTILTMVAHTSTNQVKILSQSKSESKVQVRSPSLSPCQESKSKV